MKSLPQTLRVLGVLAGIVGVVLGTTFVIQAAVPNPDPCSSKSGDAYSLCRFDRLENKMDAGFSSLAKPTQTVTVTATPNPAAAPTTAAPTAAPTTATASPATPSQTAPAPNAPTASTGCVKPSASNTGASGTLATYNGPTTITTPGTTIQNVRVNGGLEVQADNVTIKNVEAPGGVFVNRAANTKIINFTGSSIASSSGTGVVIDHSNLGGVNDGDSIHLTSDNGIYINSATVTNNWIHDPHPPAGAHYDGIQVRGASNVLIGCNTIDAGTYQSTYNAAVYFEYANGGYSGVTIRDNWLIGSAFSVMMGTANDDKTTLDGNHFSGDIHWTTCYDQQPNSRPPTQTGNDLDSKPFTPCN